MSFPKLLMLLALALPLVASAATEVRTSLSESEVSVGETVDLKIEISGSGGQPQMRGTPRVDGLEIGRGSVSMSYRIDNNGSTQILALLFPIETQREGTFIIPPLQIQIGNEPIVSEAVTLKVTSAPPASRNLLAGELWVPKTTCYIGELLPVEVRLLMGGKIEARMQKFTGLDGESYTKQKVVGPRETKVRKDDRELNAQVLATAISPSRAGKITLGPTQLGALVSIPRGKRARDPFGNDFFNNPFGAFSATEERMIPVAAVELDVLPLPVAGKPADFSGAVGQFKMTVEGAPKQVKVGDPVTMNLRISGKGNFDRVNAPVLVDEAGWHPYPPGSDFKPADDLATTGTKTFEIAVVPEVNKTEMPRFQFSYFDADAAKYVTLKTESIPLTVTGAPPPPAPVVTQIPPEAPPPAKQAATDILGLKYEMGPQHDSFEPFWRSRAFLLAQGVPFLGLLVLLGVRFSRKDEGEHRRNTLRREHCELWRKLRRAAPDAEFFQLAARLVQVEVALRTGAVDASVDAAAARASRPLDDETAAGIDEIFSARAEVLYAGTAGGSGNVLASDKERVLATLERFEKGRTKHE